MTSVTEALTTSMALSHQQIKWKIIYFFVQQLIRCGAFKYFINIYCE